MKPIHESYQDAIASIPSLPKPGARTVKGGLVTTDGRFFPNSNVDNDDLYTAELPYRADPKDRERYHWVPAICSILIGPDANGDWTVYMD